VVSLASIERGARSVAVNEAIQEAAWRDVDEAVVSKEVDDTRAAEKTIRTPTIRILRPAIVAR
jgi:hypothetical protein